MKKDHKVKKAEIDLVTQCAICPIKGLFPEVCKLHRNQLLKNSKMGISFAKKGWVCWGAKIAAGAGIGLAGAVGGLAVIPAFGAKAVLGHMIGYQIAGVATVAGAGTNFAIQMKNRSCSTKKHKQRPGVKSRNRYSKLPYSLSSQGR